MTPPAASRVTPNARRYASRIAQAYANRLPYLADDIHSAAQLGLVHAAATFREDGGDFLCYSRRRIVGEILDELRRHDPLSRAERQKVRRGRAEPVTTTSYDGLVHDHPPSEAPDLTAPRDVETMLAVLPARLEYVVRWHFLQAMTFAEVGRRLRVTESRACQMAMEALGRLRAKFGSALA